MPVAAVPPPSDRPRRAGARRPAVLLPVPAARLAGFALLGSLGVLQWARMVEELSALRALSWVAVAIAGALAVVAAERLAGRRRVLAVCGAAVAALALGWVAAGADLGLLRRERWPELFDGLARGTEALGTVRLPYDGQDPWPALVLQLLGAGLCVLAGLLALWPREGGRGEGGRGYPYLALAALLTLAATPVISIGGPRQIVLGLALAALTVVFLWLERLPLKPGMGVAGLLGLALAGALPLATMADREEPWFDYKAFAEGIGPDDPISFDWDHSDYGPIDWPREGLEVMRVHTKDPGYWKLATLADFDGSAWRGRDPFSSMRESPLSELPATDDGERWRRRVRVSVRRLQSDLLAAPGVILEQPTASRPVEETEPGVWRVRGGLRPGDSYTASSYAPQPTPRQLARAASGNFSLQDDELEIVVRLAQLPEGVADDFSRRRSGFARVEFRAFGLGPPSATAIYPRFDTVADGAEALEAAGFARVFELAQRLRERTDTPAAYALAVNRYLQRGFTYNERPGEARFGQQPLDYFLFNSRQGYCQHYSAAMALLLRMGGVPARVATGFSPGGYSESKNAWIVRDTDAHSWVEAWFDDIGWVTFDPTPASTPARSQIAALEPEPTDDGAGADAADAGAAPTPADPSAARADVTAAAEGAGDASGDGGLGWWQVAAAVLAAALVVAVLWRARRRRRGPGSMPPAERALAELERAVVRSGRTLAPGATLLELERDLRLSGDAAGYLRALSAARYAPAGGARQPTRDQRRALRRDLAQGQGLSGRLRLFAALPPRR
jgi:transglutaminase-like putative cysteine protease